MISPVADRTEFEGEIGKGRKAQEIKSISANSNPAEELFNYEKS